MASNAARTERFTHLPEPLNTEVEPRVGLRATPREDAQEHLSPAFHWLEKGAQIRALLARAITANRISFADIERDTAVDEKQAGRALREGQGLNPPMQLVAYLLWQDKAGVLLNGLASMLGYEVRPKEIDLAAENRRLRARLADLASQVAAALEDA